MAYDYAARRANVFTEDGQAMFLKIWRSTMRENYRWLHWQLLGRLFISFD